MADVASSKTEGGARTASRTDRRFYARVVLLAVVALLLVLTGHLYLSVYTETVFIRAFLFSVAALTVGLLWGYTGILSFSQSTFFGIGAYAAALVFIHYDLSGTTFAAAAVAGIVLSAAVAYVTGWLAFWYRATSFYVAVVTLVLAIVSMQLIYSGGSFTGSSSGLVGFKVPPLSTAAWFAVSGCLAILVTVAASIFVHSDYGSLLKAIRDNEERCRYLGINTTRIKIRLFVAMAVVASIAGFIYACVTVLAAPEQVGFVFGTKLVIDTALGGRASVLGPVLGTTLLEWISSYLNGVLPFVWQLIVGVVFIVVIVALPEGFLPPLIRAVRRLLSRVLPVFGSSPYEIELVRRGRGEADGPRRGTASTLALSVEGLSKRYGHLTVLDGLDLDVRAGEIVGVVGPNGAGKTTLMSCVSDGLERTGGRITINGTVLARHTPTDIVALGLARSFQKTSVYENFTVAGCLLLSLAHQMKLSAWGATRRIALPDAAWRVVKDTGLFEKKDERVRNLSHGMKRALELSMALCLDPTVLLLDEPTAGLTRLDRELVGAVLRDLSRNDELTIVLIEHDFDFVKRVCSRLVVLHQGKLVVDGTVDEVVNSPVVLEIYAGNQA
ncbi:MAG: branched-chain amino acid ABC transporter ATP-binding protein/permease [Candidimonas sp.]|nr:MAG: branched-chain amino acid ABC transporter ATP-binding protein/permease [Candidimonas sp.]